jgi:phosphoenolpyruvate carboxylase
MSNMTGMDVAGVRQVALQMTTAANDIQTAMTTLTHALSGAAWVGADRERFVSDWNGEHVQALHNVIQSLTDAATLASQNAQEQETTSA